MSELRILSVEDVLAAPDVEEIVYEVPEWGGAVRIRGLSLERISFLRRQATTAGRPDNDKFESFLFRDCLVEPQLSPEQYAVLRKKPAGPLSRMMAKMMELCGLSDSAVADAEATFPEEPAT